jgi:hypothetical protein
MIDKNKPRSKNKPKGSKRMVIYGKMENYGKIIVIYLKFKIKIFDLIEIF